MELVDFLRARLDEDEGGTARHYRDLSEALRNQGMVVTADWLTERGARVLAEVEAKRRIIDLAREANDLDELADERRIYSVRNPATEPFVGDQIVRLLALPYADHPDYEESWRP